MTNNEIIAILQKHIEQINSMYDGQAYANLGVLNKWKADVISTINHVLNSDENKLDSFKEVTIDLMNYAQYANFDDIKYTQGFYDILSSARGLLESWTSEIESMDAYENKFRFPDVIDSVLFTLSAIYKNNSKDILASIITNADINYDIGDVHDRFSGDTFGHKLYLLLPTELYLQIEKELESYSETIASDINSKLNIQSEYVSKVVIDISESSITKNWREHSGLLINTAKITKEIEQKTIDSIWSQNTFKLFISHKATIKKFAKELKDALIRYGIDAFVAHEDIPATTLWLETIENALFSADTLIGLLSDDFHSSEWTDQEIGIAIGRNIPVFMVKLAVPPYGFVGKFQAIPYRNGHTVLELAHEIFWHLLENSIINEKVLSALVFSFENAPDYYVANDLFNLFLKVDSIPKVLLNRISKAYENNPNVKAAYTVKNRLQELILKQTI
jgi:hypothetical protein